MDALRAATGVAETDEMRAKIEATRTVANYAESSLPDFVRDRSLCQSFSRAIVENHAWVSASAWGPYDPIVPKYIRAQVLGISMLWLMVAVAVQKQLSSPDLGCDLYTNEVRPMAWRTRVVSLHDEERSDCRPASLYHGTRTRPIAS